MITGQVNPIHISSIDTSAYLLILITNLPITYKPKKLEQANPNQSTAGSAPRNRNMSQTVIR
ncbi:hypothetical protein, partial [Pseudomonas karstica]|uniref:hypothetical protein n=1 Tax=Pseudomonas karstica TaxID=1055468 RepID=UPI001C49B85F